MDMVEDFIVYISKRKDKKLIKKLKRNGMKLRFLSDKNKNIRKYVLEAVKQNGMALEYASDILKNDYNIVLTAVRQNGFAYFWASENLKYNINIIVESLKQNIEVANIIPEKIQKYKNYFISKIDYEYHGPE